MSRKRSVNSTGERASAKLRKARIRHFLLTTGPNRLTRGWFYRRHHAEDVLVREEEIIVPGWPTAFDGIRIGHISDIHVGDLMLADRALGVVEQLRSAAPDMICNTGDLVDLHWPGVEKVAEAIANIKAPLGNFFVLGHHDLLDSRFIFRGTITKLRMTVLRPHMFMLPVARTS